MAKKFWIKGAVKHPGALRAKAMKMGLISKGETLSESDLNRLSKSGDTKTKRRVALARTFKKMHKK